MGNATFSSCGAGIVRAVDDAPCIGGFGPSGTPTAAPVVLNVYDLNKDWLQANTLFRDVLKIGGAFHTGVEVYGNEWSYGSEGVSTIPPKSHEVHVFRQSVEMGYTTMSEGELLQFIERVLIPQWQDSDYDILSWNCCSFADILCRKLVRTPIPSWVTRFPNAASVASKGFGKVIDLGGSVASAAPGCHEDEALSSLPSTPSVQTLRSVGMSSQSSTTTRSLSCSEAGSPHTPSTPGHCFRRLQMTDPLSASQHEISHV